MMGESTRVLTLADFTPRLGTGFEVAVQGGSVTLKLQAAQELPSMGRSGGSFRLEFIGPAQPMLPQSTYSFRFGDEAVGIFIVPIGQEPRGTRYEAIFI
ncbi:MAG TPA: hypothetical protein VFO69_02975 [Allosphingosinicella sp.]|nr:hypothetical protein [Allosphingosinicella sp.]